MSWIVGLDGCRRWVSAATVQAWQGWRALHPAWLAPVRAAAVACGASAMVSASALAPLPIASLAPHAIAPEVTHDGPARMGDADSGAIAVGAAGLVGGSTPSLAARTPIGLDRLPSYGELRVTAREPVPVPEPPSWLLLLPALLFAIGWHEAALRWSRRARRS